MVAARCWRPRHRQLISPMQHDSFCSPRLCDLLRQKFLAFMVTLFIATSSYADSSTRLDGFLADLHTFHAAFEQQLLNEYDELLEKSTGVVYLRRPGMLHWAYREPYAQQIISDGTTLWIYDQDLAQVSIRDALDAIENTPTAILTANIDIKAHYIIIELEPEGGLDWLELTPRDIDSQYSAIRFGFNAESLSAMILFDNLGQKIRIDFQKPQRNTALGQERFQFSLPKGVDVIDARQQ